MKKYSITLQLPLQMNNILRNSQKKKSFLRSITKIMTSNKHITKYSGNNNNNNICRKKQTVENKMQSIKGSNHKYNNLEESRNPKNYISYMHM